MDALELQQVIVFSRHGIRTPLPNTINFLKTVTPKHWPSWDCPAGYLTTQGGVLESYFGDYFIKWLASKHLKLSAEDVFVYANSLHRTVATAQYFTLGAFSGLDIPVKHKYPIERMDPIFNPIIHNDCADFKNGLIDNIRQFTGSSQLIEKLDEQLIPAYRLLANILDYKHSSLYQQYQCEFEQLPTMIDFVKNDEPILNGPLAIGTAVADAWTLQYYSAFAKQDIAWGMINSHEQWKIITDIKNQYINLLFKSPTLSRHIAKPLITFIASLFESQQHKFSLLVGHDSNIAAFLGALGFKNYQLPEQCETTPIGGKVVMCRYYDRHVDQHYFKVEYLYQSFEQIHLGVPLTANNPPNHITLTLSDKAPNSQGMYLWQEIKQRVTHYLSDEI